MGILLLQVMALCFSSLHRSSEKFQYILNEEWGYLKALQTLYGSAYSVIFVSLYMASFYCFPPSIFILFLVIYILLTFFVVTHAAAFQIPSFHAFKYKVVESNGCILIFMPVLSLISYGWIGLTKNKNFKVISDCDDMMQFFFYIYDGFY